MGAISAAEILDENLIVAKMDGTMAFADQRTGRSQLALSVAAYQKLRHLDFEDLPLHLACSQDDETQLHKTTSL